MRQWGPERADVEVVERRVGYSGFFELAEYRLRHRLFDGRMSQEVRRELFERGHAAAVLPYDPVRDEVVLIEQFRIGALEEPGGPWLLEIVAGIIDPGESAEEVARREAVEEAGCELQALAPICEFLVSPGGTSERIALFCGRVDAEGVGGIHGLAGEQEDIRVSRASYAQAWEWVQDGTIHSAAPIIALQWLTMNRDRLRMTWR